MPQAFGDRQACRHNHTQIQHDTHQMPGLMRTGDITGFILDLMLVQQLPGRPQTVLIDELDDGNQLFQFVFQRRTGQHHGVGTIDALQRSGSNGVPVLDTLRLVDNHQIRRPRRNQIQIGLEFFVIGDLAEIIADVILLSLRTTSSDDERIAAGKPLDFALPLVLERCRTDYQHFRYAEMPRQNFGGRDGLDGFAQAHFIANQRPARPDGEQCAFGLIGIHGHFEQVLHQGISTAAWKNTVERYGTPLGIAPSGNKIKRIVIGAQFMPALGHCGNKMLQFAKLLW